MYKRQPSHPLNALHALIAKYRLATLRKPSARQQLIRRSQVIETGNSYQECRAVMTAIQDLIKKNQDPSKIGIVVTSESRYRNYLKTLVHEANLKANIALSFPLASTQIGRWLKHTIELCSKGFDRHQLHAWLHCEISEQYLHAQGRNTKYLSLIHI